MYLLQLVSTGQKLHNFINTCHQGCKRTANVWEKIWTLGSGSEGKGGLCVCTSVSVGRSHSCLTFISINSVCKHPDTAVFHAGNINTQFIRERPVPTYLYNPLDALLPTFCCCCDEFCQNCHLTTYSQNFSCSSASQAAGTASLLTYLPLLPSDAALCSLPCYFKRQFQIVRYPC